MFEKKPIYIDINDFLRKHNNPPIHLKGYYKNDYKGFCLAMEERKSIGIPLNKNVLMAWCKEFNCPIPDEYKYMFPITDKIKPELNDPDIMERYKHLAGGAGIKFESSKVVLISGIALP